MPPISTWQVGKVSNCYGMITFTSPDIINHFGNAAVLRKVCFIVDQWERKNARIGICTFGNSTCNNEIWPSRHCVHSANFVNGYTNWLITSIKNVWPNPYNLPIIVKTKNAVIHVAALVSCSISTGIMEHDFGYFMQDRFNM